MIHTRSDGITALGVSPSISLREAGELGKVWLPFFQERLLALLRLLREIEEESGVAG